MKKTQTQSFWRKQAVRFARFFAISTACLTFLSACDKLNSSPEKLAQITQAEKASRLKRGIYGTQFQLDPHFVTNAAESALVRDLLVGLVAFDPHGNIIPAIAQNWFTEDNKSWLFVLDDKAMWSNGEPVTAKDFVASWQRLATPQTAGTEMPAVLSPLSPYLVYMNVANAQAVISGKKSAEHLGVEALNANTLKITLEKPNAQFPKMLAHTALLPTYQGEIPETTHFVSNGSYVIDEITPEKITLATRQIETPFTTVSYHLLDNDSVAKEMDLVENPPASHKNTATLPRLCTYFYEFNFADPQLAKKEVRQAIKMKIHSARIAGKYGLFNDAILPQAMRENAERQWKPVFFEELLTRAGVSLEQPLRLTLTYDNQGQHGAIANQMVRTLGESDLVRITPQAVDFDQLLAKHSQKDFQLIRSGWCVDHAEPAAFLWKYHSASPNNKMNYQNAQVDKGLERLKHDNLNEAERKALITQITHQLEADVAVLPMFQYQRHIVVDSTLLGIDFSNPSEVIYSKDLFRITPLNIEKDTNEPTH